ncbi:MAG: hypothetical protein WC222_04445 [Parachlamydiales bacterium]
MERTPTLPLFPTMIPISLPTLLLLYLTLTTLSILIWWAYDQRLKKSPPPPEHKLTTCEFCSFQYLAPHNKPISKCPQCSSLTRGLRPLDPCQRAKPFGNRFPPSGQ